MVEKDIEANGATLDRLLGRKPISFAYPYGDVSLRSRKALGRRFVTCRGIRSGPNGLNADAACLYANPIYASRYDLDIARKLIDAATAADAWLIFYTHDVQRDPTAYGCTPEQLAAVVAYAVASTKVRTVGKVFGASPSPKGLD